jgi:hypothetical protein
MAAAPERTGRGLARERTSLAWTRSGLAAAVCIAVLLRHLWPLRGDGQDLALGLVAATAIVWAIAYLAFTIVGDGRDEHSLRGQRAFFLVTIGTAMLGVVAFGLAFLAPP